MPESAFVVRNRDQIPLVGRITSALQIWRDTATGQAAAAAARGGRMIRGSGRGRASGRGKGLGRKKRIKMAIVWQWRRRQLRPASGSSTSKY